MIADAERISALISTGQIGTFTIILLIVLIIHYRKLFDFIEHNRTLRISHLEKALQSEHIKGKTRDHLIREYEKAYYNRTVGINVEREFREKIIESFESAKGEINFHHFRRAMHNIDYEDGEIITTKPNLAWFGFITSCIGLTLMTFITIPGLILYAENFTKLSTLHHLGMLVVAAEFLIIILITLKDLLLIISTHHIETHIRKSKSAKNTSIDDHNGDSNKIDPAKVPECAAN